MPHRFFDTLKDLTEVFVVNIGAVAVYLNISFVFDYFAVANEFFQMTEYLWKSIPLILASLYTSIKICREIKAFINNRNNKPNKPE